MLPATWLTEVIKIAAWCAVAISIYFVFWPRIKPLLSNRDLASRHKELRKKYRKRKIDEADVHFHRGLLLRHIKAARQKDDVICLFVNDGDSVLNLSVEADDDVRGTIDPRDNLESGQAGSIRLHIPPSSWPLNEVTFSIRYEDSWGHIHRTRYVYDAQECLLCEERKEEASNTMNERSGNPNRASHTDS